jgi:hypothetical protein
MPSFMKIVSIAFHLFHANRWTDWHGETDRCDLATSLRTRQESMGKLNMQQKDTKTNLAVRRTKGGTTWGYAWGKLGLWWIMAAPGCFTLRLDIQLFQDRSLILFTISATKSWMRGGCWVTALPAEQVAEGELTWSMSINVARCWLYSSPRSCYSKPREDMGPSSDPDVNITTDVFRFPIAILLSLHTTLLLILSA